MPQYITDPDLLSQLDGSARTRTPQEFTKAYAPAAERAGKALGVDPGVLLGQWGLETGWGKSIIPGTNNLGNIKDFAGGGVAATDNMNGSRDKYRAYQSPEAFADDFASLIQRKYPDAVGSGTDLAKFTGALTKGGYAEDPRYAEKVGQAARMAGVKQNPVVAAVGRAVESVMPAAQAAERQYISDPELLAQLGAEPARPSMGETIAQGAGNLAAGAVRGAGSIGATLLAPYDMARDALDGKGLSLESNRQRRVAMDAGLQSMGAEPDSLLYKGGKLAGEIAGTAGVGGTIARGAGAMGASPQMVNALASSGLRTGVPGGNRLADLAIRAAGGAVSGGAAAGLVNPEDAKTGAMIGGALPPVVQGLGAVGGALARTIRGPDVPEAIGAAAAAGREAGYVIPPTQARPTLTNRLLEGVSGKITTAQNASARNQEVTNRLAQQAIGAPELSPAGLQAVREQANAAYSALGQAGEFTADDAFRKALGSVGAPSAKLKQDFPALANRELEGIVDSFNNTTKFDAQSAIEAIKELRAAQRAGLASQDPAVVALSRAKGRISDALENLVERNLSAKGQTELLDSYRQARQTLAKTYDVEKAMNPATGNVDAKKLTAALKKGRLSGELQQIGEFASSFPKAAQTVENMGSLPQTSPLDWSAGLLATGASGSPLGMLGVVARPAARAMTLSPMVQNRLLQSASTPMLSDATRQNLLLPLYRSGPLLGSDR